MTEGFRHIREIVAEVFDGISARYLAKVEVAPVGASSTPSQPDGEGRQPDCEAIGRPTGPNKDNGFFIERRGF